MSENFYVSRHIEKQIPQILETFPILMVTGPRQVGKTTMLTHTLPSEYSFITLDDLVVRQQAQNDPALLFINYPDKLFIDEAQYASTLFSQLKLQVDQNKTNGKYVLSGSQKYALMDKASESLAGRIAVLELQGYSMRELLGKSFYAPFIPSQSYIDARKSFETARKNAANNSSTENSLWDHIQRGLLPRVQDQKVNWEMYYASYVQTYIERDVRQLAQVGDEMQFRQFLVAMAARTGELLNYTNISRDVGVSVDTIRRWTSILRASGIIELLPPYANNALTRAIKTPKLYFMDTGLVCYLTGWLTAEVLRRGAKAGNLFETFVVSEIIKSWRNVGKDTTRLYFYRDKQGNEIDLLFVENGVIHPVEIKMTASPNLAMAKSFKQLSNIFGLELGTGSIVCQKEEPWYLSETVISLPAATYL
jgi:predicted AAA+ superfamily ATPase